MVNFVMLHVLILFAGVIFHLLEILYYIYQFCGTELFLQPDLVFQFF